LVQFLFTQQEEKMIRIVSGLNYAAHANELDQMYRLRKRVFHDRLQWDVQVTAEYEIDSYDTLRPLYVLAMDDSGKHVVGSLRLLPTTGPNMLNDTFSALLPDGQPYRSATVWESSRYCVDTESAEKWCKKGVHQASAELLLSLCEVGMLAGLTFIVTVIDLRMERILRRLNCMGERIGGPCDFGAVKAIAGIWETNEATLAELQASSGIHQSVLEDRTQLIKLAA
jgi:acyl homoserine lactone synthase